MTREESTTFGNYRLLQKLAHGGMAEVFVGVERDGDPLGPKLVIKRILPDLAKDPRFVAMFLNEAQLAAQMSHPHIARVLDFGEEGGRLFMVMEYVEGLDCWKFARRLHPWGPKHEAIAVYIAMGVLDGLDYAHKMTDIDGRPLSVVHRDLSPSNIYLSLGGEVKVGDFGIARIDSRRYRPVEIIPKGKFGYMAPEQVEGRAIDKRADVYSVGVVLAELLIGRKLFSGTSQLSVLLDIRDGRMEALDDAQDRIPPQLMRVLRAAMARKPGDRFASAADFANALSVYLDSKGAQPSAADLAEQVKRAQDLADPRSSTPGLLRPPTPRTGEHTLAGSILTAEANREDTEPRQSLSQSTSIGATPITAQLVSNDPAGMYTARLDDGMIIGPTSFAHIIELIYSDRIQPGTLISVGGSEYVQAADVAELARHLPAYTPTAEVDSAIAPDKRGYLEMETAVEVLLSLAVRREEGLLLCQRDGCRKEVYFRDGAPVYVGSNDPSELLGESLVRCGAIDRMELDMALALLPKFNGHMGDTLIALGMLSAVDLFSHITKQIRSRLLDLFAWRTGRYEFFRGAKCRPGVFEINIDPFAFAREALLSEMQKLDVGQIFREMRTVVVAPTPMTLKLCDKLGLPPEIEERVRSVGDWVSVGELETSAGKTAPALARALFVALETGLWKFDGPSPPWRFSKPRAV